MKQKKNISYVPQAELEIMASIYNKYILSSLEKRRINIISSYNSFGIDLEYKLEPPEISGDIDNCQSFIDSFQKYEAKLIELELEFNKIAEKEKLFTRELKTLIINGTFLEEVIKNLVSAIRSHVKEVASPLSGEIFELKKGLNTFTKSFTQWREELTDPKSSNNYANVISSFNNQTDNFTNMGKKLEADFTEIRGAFDLVNDMFSKISEYSDKIEHIASDIKTLSINASIEAARAGIHGKGFKVIATGTQELSEQTNSLLVNITNVIKETKDIIGKTQDTLREENDRVVENIKYQSSGFKLFHDILEDFYNRFNIVFTDITNGTKETFTHINKIMPTVQLHDGIEQQLGNITEMIDLHSGIAKENVTGVLNISDNTTLQEIRNNIIDKFEKQVTTDLEVNVLADLVKKYGLIRENKIEIIEDDIEFF